MIDSAPVAGYDPFSLTTVDALLSPLVENRKRSVALRICSLGYSQMRQTTLDSRWKLTIVGYRRIETFLTHTEATFLLFIFTCILRIDITCSSIVLHRRLPSNLTIYFSIWSNLLLLLITYSILRQCVTIFTRGICTDLILRELFVSFVKLASMLGNVASRAILLRWSYTSVCADYEYNKFGGSVTKHQSR